MPSRAYTSLLLWILPVGRLFNGCVNALSGLYLIVTVQGESTLVYAVGVNALSGLYLIVTEEMISISTSTINVSMPSRAYTSLLLMM